MQSLTASNILRILLLFLSIEAHAQSDVRSFYDSSYYYSLHYRADSTLDIMVIEDTVTKVITFMSWDFRGQLNMWFQSKEDLEHKFGEKIEYYHNGNRKRESTYIDGKLNGVFIEYNKNGKKEKEGYYINDKKDGKFTVWWPDTGNIKSEEYYDNGRRHGPYFTYYPTGTLETQSTYVRGNEEGISTWFNENGKIETQICYLRGKLLYKVK